MTSAAVLSVLVRANTAQANAALAGTEAQLKKVAATSTATTGTMAARAGALGSTLTKSVTLPLVGIAAAASAMSMDFNRSMRLIQTQAGASTAELAKMKKEVLDFAASGKTTESPKELSEALYRVESAGYRGAKAMEVLEASTALAEIGQADLEQTTNAVVAAMKTGVRGTGNMSKTIGTLNAIVGAGNMRMEDLTSAMGTGFLTNAKQMGVSLKQAGAALATLTVQGQPATASATRLSMAFRMMMAPTDGAKTALRSIGLEAETLGVMMQKGNFPAAVSLLSEKLDALGTDPRGLQQKAAVIREIFGARSSTGINAIIQGLDDYRVRLKQIGETGDKVDESLAAVQAQPGFKMQAAVVQLQAALIRLGDILVPVLVPALTKFLTVLGDTVEGFTALPQPIKTATLLMLGMAAAAGPLLKLLAVVLKLRIAFATLAIAQGLAGGAGAAGAFGGASGLMATAGGVSGAALGAGVLGVAGGIAVGGGIAAATTAKSPGELGIQVGQQKKLLDGLTAFLKTHQAITSEQEKRVFSETEELVKMKAISQEQKTMLDRQASAKAPGSQGQSILKDFTSLFTMEREWAKIPVAAKNAADGAVNNLKELPEGARQQAAATMVTMASVLESQGKLPKQAVKTLVKEIRSAFPGMEVPAINAAQKLAKGVAGAFNKLAGLLRNPIEGMVNLIGSFLSSLGIGGVSFSGVVEAGKNIVGGISGTIGNLLGGGGDKKGNKGMQRGGLQMVPGVGSGDSFPVQALLEPGEIFGVLNRNAAGAIMEANAQWPRLAGGGVLEQAGIKELQLAGAATLKFLRQQSAKANRATGGAGKHRSYPHLSGDTDFSPALGNALSHLAKKVGTDISVTSGWRSRAEQAALYQQKGPGLAAPPGSSNHERGTAADIAPGVSVFGGAAGQFGLRFPMSYEPWHIELAKRGGVFDRMQKGGVRYGKWLKHGSHWLHPHNPVTADEGHTLLWQAGLSDADAGRLTTVLPDESLGDWFADNATTDALGVWQILGKATGSPAGPLTNPIINSINAAIKWRTEGSGAWPTYPGSGPEGHILRNLVTSAKKHGKTKKVGAGGGELGSHMLNALAAAADTYGEYADRAGALEGPVYGKSEADWLHDQLDALKKLRNALIEAHEKLQAMIKGIRKVMESANKKTKGKLRDKVKKLSGIDQAVVSKLSDVQGAVSGDLRFQKLSPLPAPGALGGAIFDVQMKLQDLGESTSGSSDDLTQLKLDEALKALQVMQVDKKLWPVLSMIPQIINAEAGLSNFVGGFAKGGFIAPGKWGWTGEEGPEPVYGGRTGATVLPAETRAAAAGPTQFEVHIHGDVIPFEDHVGAVIEIRERKQSSNARRSING